MKLHHPLHARLKKYLLSLQERGVKLDFTKVCEATYQMMSIDDVLEKVPFDMAMAAAIGKEATTCRNTRKSRTINATVRIADPRCSKKECAEKHMDLFVEDGETFFKYVPSLCNEPIKYYDKNTRKKNHGARNFKTIEDWADTIDGAEA